MKKNKLFLFTPKIQFDDHLSSTWLFGQQLINVARSAKRAKSASFFLQQLENLEKVFFPVFFYDKCLTEKVKFVVRRAEYCGEYN